MKLCLLTRFHSNHDNSSFVKRLMQEAALTGHHFMLVNPSEITLQFQPPHPGAPTVPVAWNGQPLPKFDLIHYALRWDDEHAWQILESMRDWGHAVLPPHRVPLGDSITMTRLFARAGLRTPRSWVLPSAAQLAIVLPELPFPCVFRVRKGTQGRTLYVANHSAEAMQIAESLTYQGYNFMVQEIMPPTGVDVRVFMVGNKVVTAVERIAPMSYLRPSEEGNLRVQPTTLTEEEKRLAETAMRIYGAPYAAISFLRREYAEPILLEVSRVPTLTEVETVTGVNVAAEIVRHLAEAAEQAVKTGNNVVPITRASAQ